NSSHWATGLNPPKRGGAPFNSRLSSNHRHRQEKGVTRLASARFREEAPSPPIHCCICTNVISGERDRRRAVTCSGECQRVYRNYRRRVRASAKCRLCGRGRSRKGILRPVPMEHMASQDELQSNLLEGRQK